MSAKTSKRRQKRLNTNDEELEISEKSISLKKIDSEQHLKDDISEHSESTENDHKNDSTEEQNGHKIEENSNQNGDHHDSKNGFHEENNKEELNESHENNHEIIDGIVIETANDDTHSEDLHLSIDVTPEKETEKEREKSPVLTGMTTRSHRNSPKVDKTNENGMDTKLTNEVNVNLKTINEESENKETKTTQEEKVSEDTKVEEPKVETETEEKDTTNASIFVNVGNDTTHNVDMTTTSVIEESASYLDSNKDVPYPQAIRTLSGRRALRRDSPFVPNRGKTHLEKNTTDSRRSYIPHISSVKRKNTSELPDDSKRYKTEGSPGILSYISSPLASFRNRLSRTELPSSTPKLTSYNKYTQGNNIIEDMSQIDLTEETSVAENQVEPKKWCSIM